MPAPDSEVDNHARSLATGHLHHGLAGRSIRSGALTLGTQVIKFGVSLLSVAVLARLLAPSDFGLVAMVIAITGFIDVFKDLGLSAATIQSRDLDQRQVSALFWLNAGLGAVLALLCIAVGPLIASFYGNAQLSQVTTISSVGFLLSGFAVQHRALLSRQMRFVPLAIIDLIALTGSTVAAIALAWLGYGYLALAWAPVVASAMALVGVVVALDWWPDWPRRAPGVRALLRYGGDISAFNGINYLGRNLDNILIGKVWGAEALGLYARAYTLLLLPLRQISGPITAVAFPALSTLRSDPRRFRSYYLKVLFLLTSLTTPLYLVLAILAPEVITIVLGPQWQEAADIFRFLAISAIAQPICNTSGLLYMTMGDSRGLLKAGSIGTAAMVAAFIVGLPYGPKGVAAAYAVAMLLWLYPCMWLAAKRTSVRTVEIFATAAQPVLASLPGIGWILLVKYLWGAEMPLWTWLPVALAGMAFLYLLMLATVLGKARFLRGILSQLLLGQRAG